jgi:hypothetical protein
VLLQALYSARNLEGNCAVSGRLGKWRFNRKERGLRVAAKALFFRSGAVIAKR